MFISKAYQGLGLGSAAVDLLERIAVEEYAAKALLIHTGAYVCHWMGDHWVEETGVVARNVKWYQSRGYEPYGVSRPDGSLGADGEDTVLRYPNGAKDDLTPRIHSINLKKVVG